MSTHDTTYTIDTIIDRTLITIEKSLDNLIGDMELMNALRFIGTMMDLRERHHQHMQNNPNA